MAIHEKGGMKMDTPDHPAESRGREALSTDVRVFIESHLRELAENGRLGQLARSREALMTYYRVQRNDAAVYVLANAPDFSMTLMSDGGVALALPGQADPIVWTQQELQQERRDEVIEVESRAVQMAGGLERFRALSDEEQEELTARAVEEAFKRLRDG